MSRSRLLDTATTNTPDRIAELERQLAQRDADLAEMTRSQPDRDRLAKIRRERQDDETIDRFRALPDAEARLAALANIVADHLARRCLWAISLDERVEIVRMSDGAMRTRLRETIVPRSNWQELELLATADEDLPQYVRVTASPGSRGSERQVVSEEDAQRYRDAGLGDEVHTGRVDQIDGWSLGESRSYRIVAADEWELRLAVDRELAALVREGKIVATPLTPDEVRAGIARGELTP